MNKKVEHIDLHLEGKSIKSIDFVDPATYIGINRKNQIFIYSIRQRKILQTIDKQGGWGSIKFVQSLFGSNRHFLLRNDKSIYMIALALTEEQEFKSEALRLFDLEFNPQIAYGIDSACFYMKLSLNFQEYKDEGYFKLFLLKTEDLAQRGQQYNKRAEDLN